MKAFMWYAMGFIGILILCLSVTWIVQGNNFFMYRVFGLRYEQTRREIFEQSKAYRQGMVQELENMLYQYEQADENHKAALASMILHRAADIPDDAIPYNLRASIQQLRNQMGKSQKQRRVNNESN